MLLRIFACSVLLSPLVLVAAAPTAVAAVGSPSGSSAVTARAVAAAPAAATAPAAARPTLRLGSRGAAVVTLQKRLIALHYFDVSRADGVFGADTHHAVVAFQKVQGLGRDGIVGPATRAKLARPYAPAARYRLAAASVEVNLAKQVLYYLRGGAIQRIIDASTGSGTWYYSQGRWAKAITPAGRFRIYWRYPGGWQSGPLGALYRPNYFYRGYALHGMTSVPAYPASHGCVRMTVRTMDRMWPALRVGMPVAIYRS